MYLVISTSLNPDSRSRILAQAAADSLSKRDIEFEFMDLAEMKLPPCDGATCYGQPESIRLTETVSNARGILIASPIYNYDLSASAKNMIEISGKAWTDKVVGFLCAAGGQGSFMAPMQMANSLMLDFRSLILPRFVYATGDSFSGNQIADTDCDSRITELVTQLVTVTQALNEQASA